MNSVLILMFITGGILYLLIYANTDGLLSVAEFLGALGLSLIITVVLCVIAAIITIGIMTT